MPRAKKNISDSRQITTLVFFDTETTNLPSRTTNLTEICFISVHRKHFDDPSFQFRVLNKITLCVNPRSKVNSTAAFITGLNNSNLRTQQQFSTSTASLLKAFLEQLDPPICMLAHNGKTFDFPLFKSEMDRVSPQLLDNILFVDTLFLLRQLVPPPGYVPSAEDMEKIAKQELTLPEIVKIPKLEHLQPIDNSVIVANSSASVLVTSSPTASKIENNNTVVTAASPVAVQIEEISVVKEVVDPTTDNSIFIHDMSQQGCAGIYNIANIVSESGLIGNNTSLMSVIMPYGVNSTANTGSQNIWNNACPQIENNVNQLNVEPGKKPKKGGGKRKATVVKQKLVGGPWKKNGGGYKLNELYARVVGEPLVDAHTAEADTIALMKVCFRVKDFSIWMDDKAELIQTVNKMW